MWRIITESLDFGGACGIKPKFDGVEFGTAMGAITSGPVGTAAAAAVSTAFDGDPNPCFGIYLDYNIPYYVVEVVPTRWQSLLFPDVGQRVIQPVLGQIEQLVEPFVRPLGVRLDAGVERPEVHVYRLAFDVGAMVKDVIDEIVKGLATHGAYMNLSWKDAWASPSVCYLSEFDLFRWKGGLPMREQKIKKGTPTCEVCGEALGVKVCSDVSCKKSWLPGFKKHVPTFTIFRDPADTVRFWEGVNQPGLLPWGNLHERSGRLKHADPRFGMGRLALAGASLGVWEAPLAASSGGGCWIDGRGADELDPLDPDVLSIPWNEQDGLSIQLVHTGAGGATWNSCVPIGYDPKQWDRQEYWTGNVSEGALFVIYQHQRMCLFDLNTYLKNTAWFFVRLSQDLGAEAGSLGTAGPAIIADYVYTISNAIKQIRNLYQSAKEVLDFAKKIEEKIHAMVAVLQQYLRLFQQIEPIVRQAAGQTGPTVIHAAMKGLMTHFQVDPDVESGVYDVECAVDIGRHALEAGKTLTGLSACGMGTGDIPGASLVKTKIAAVESRIPPVLLKPPLSHMAEQACTIMPVHAPVQTVHTKLDLLHRRLAKLEGYLTYADYACAAVRLISNPPRDTADLIRKFGDVKLGEVSPVVTLAGDLGRLGDPSAMLSGILSSLSAPASRLPALELQWWQNEVQGLQSSIAAAGLTGQGIRARALALRDAVGPDFVKDLVKPVEVDVKALFSPGTGVPKGLWEDMGALTHRGEKLMRKLREAGDITSIGSPEEVMEALIAFAEVKVEFEKWLTDAQGAMKKAGGRKASVGSASQAVSVGLGSLPDKLRNLDRDFADRVYAAAFLSPVALRQMGDRLGVMANRARGLRDAPPGIEGTLRTASDGLIRVSDAMGKFSKGTLYAALNPIHDALGKAADALEGLVGKGKAAGQGNLLAELEGVSGDFGTMAADFETLSSSFTGPVFKGTVATGAEVWEFLQLLEAVARMRSGASSGTLQVAREEVRAGGVSRAEEAAAAEGRYVRKKVEPRQKEIDDAQGNVDQARDVLERKAKEEYLKRQGYGMGKPTDPGPTHQQLTDPNSPYMKALDEAKKDAEATRKQRAGKRAEGSRQACEEVKAKFSAKSPEWKERMDKIVCD
ncbi:MAG: hypothetical protein HYY13_13540 [Nitrospirae bacterium]|nr:hypothetical protein [Nitrospirota bacterium]